MFRTADQTWVKNYIFYVTRSNAGTYTIPDTTIVFVKGEQAGSYGIGSFFGATASGYFELGSEGEVDAYTTSLGYGFKSIQLAIEWCDDGTCP